MKKLLILTLLGFSLAAGPAFAADVAPKKATTSVKAVKVAKVAKVTSKTKTLAEKGRWHTIHKTTQLLDCADCHGGGENDILFLRHGEFQGKDGPVDRKGCLECHQSPATPTYYDVAK